METVDFETGVHAAAIGTVLVDRSTVGILKISGGTRTDLIHRMSTQDLRGMVAGEQRATILTTEIGRIIDRLTIKAFDDHVLVMTGEGNRDNIGRYLMRFVFFNDDFQLEPVVDAAVFALYGNALPDLSDLPDNVTVWQTAPIGEHGVLVSCAADDAPQIVNDLIADGVVPIDEETFDYLRIGAGIPRFGRELTTDYIPLEANLWDDVSFSKGCYIGQEIIARMESRGKLAKKLVKLTVDEGHVVQAGDEVMQDGKRVGVVTSAVHDRALGYIKTKALDAGTPMTVGTRYIVSLREG